MPKAEGVGDFAAARIARPRLVALARRALESGSLLITAGAGYGKTTLLEQALDEGGHPWAWIGCTETDRDSGALLAKLLTSVSAAVPGALGELAERLERVREPVEPRTVASQLRIELDRLLVEPVAIVFDDAERLDGASGSLAALSELLRAEGTMIRVAIASRRPLDLRVGKPRLSGRLTELGDAELAFTPDEAGALVERVRGISGAPAECEKLIAVTEGWPLGIALLTASAPREPVEAIPDRLPDGTREAMHAYLAEEILDSMEPDLRDAAIASSIVGTVTPEVVRALGFGADTIPRLGGAGLPVRRGHGGSGIAYHPLVREILRERLTSQGGGRVRSLHARVAPVIAAAGDPRQAAEHLLAAEAWPELSELLDRDGMRIARTSPELVRRWLDGLPADAATDPGLELLDGQLHWGAGDHPRAKAALEAAADGMRARGDPREWIARLMLFDALGSGGDIEGALTAMAGIDEALADAPGPFAPAAARHVAMALATFGRFGESERLDGLASRHPEAEAIVSLGSVRVAVIECLRGELDASIARLQASIGDSSRPDPLNLRFYVWQSLTRLLDDAGREAEAIATWQAVERELGEALAPYAARGGHHVQAKLHARAGRLEEARAKLATGGPAERGWRAQDRELAVAWLATLDGDTEAVAAAARRVIELQPSAPPLVQCESAADIVPPLVLSGDLERAHAVVAAALMTIDATFADRAPFLRARMLAQRAWIAATAGDIDASDDDLRSAWSLAGEARRYIVRREHARLLPLLSSALERGVVNPAEAVASLADAGVGGGALAELTHHPAAAVRRAAIRPALASGHPEAVRALATLADDPDVVVAGAARAARSDLHSAVPPLRFRILGGFAVERGRWRLSERDWGRPAAARLVRFLLVSHPEPVPADAIAEALWGRLGPKSGRGSLQVAVSRARRALDLPGTGVSVIEAVDGAYRLDLGRHGSIDAVEFERAADAALAGGPAHQVALLERARGLWGGRPLPAERYEEWTLAWRERLIDRYVDVLGTLISVHGAGADHGRAIDVARELIEIDPLNEGAHRALMVAYARAGRTGQALHQYLECRRRLVADLGVEPSGATSRLQARILAGEEV